MTLSMGLVYDKDSRQTSKPFPSMLRFDTTPDASQDSFKTADSKNISPVKSGLLAKVSPDGMERESQAYMDVSFMIMFNL
jgi:hypothetical protein